MKEMDLTDIVNILAQNIYLVPLFKGHRMDCFSFSELKISLRPLCNLQNLICMPSQKLRKGELPLQQTITLHGALLPGKML